MPYVFQSLGGTVGDLAGTSEDKRAEAARLNDEAIKLMRSAKAVAEGFTDNTLGVFSVSASGAGLPLYDAGWGQFPTANEMRAQAEAINKQVTVLRARAVFVKTLTGRSAGETNAIRASSDRLKRAADDSMRRRQDLLNRAATQEGAVATAIQRTTQAFRDQATQNRQRAATLLNEASRADQSRSARDKMNGCLENARQADASAKEIEKYVNSQYAVSAYIREMVGPTDAELNTLVQKILDLRAYAKAQNEEAERWRRMI